MYGTTVSENLEEESFLAYTKYQLTSTLFLHKISTYVSSEFEPLVQYNPQNLSVFKCNEFEWIIKFGKLFW